MVKEINNGADPAEMPVRNIAEQAIKVKIQTADELGIEIPQDVLDQATDLAKEDL